MAKTEEGGRTGVEIDYPRDLLKSLVSPVVFPVKFEEQKVAGEEEIELRLGLSLNGQFGVDRRDLKLTRCSSIPELAIQNGGFSLSTSPARACSLPSETAEWRKRKEVQSQRRMEAKRKRSEKQRNLKGGRDRRRDNGVGEEGDSGGGFGRNRSEKLPPLPPPSPASGGSQGSGSSAISEAHTQLQPIPGNNTSGEVKSPASKESSPESDRKAEKPVKIEGGEKEREMRNVLVNMPCVSTKGEGPNGRKIEGFLYRYRKGEEVRIVCVCHGRFLSPAEFVKHAGGREVTNPLKHIVVSPSFL